MSCLRFGPDSTNALLDHAAIALDLGLMQLAEADVRAVIAVDPGNGTTRRRDVCFVVVELDARLPEVSRRS